MLYYCKFNVTLRTVCTLAHERYKMILTMDIGNTNVKYGVFDGDNLIASWRVSTMASRTADEYGMVLYDLLNQSGVRLAT